MSHLSETSEFFARVCLLYINYDTFAFTKKHDAVLFVLSLRFFASNFESMQSFGKCRSIGFNGYAIQIEASTASISFSTPDSAVCSAITLVMSKTKACM